MRWFSLSQTNMLPVVETATPSRPLNSPSAEPQLPKLCESTQVIVANDFHAPHLQE